MIQSRIGWGTNRKYSLVSSGPPVGPSAWWRTSLRANRAGTCLQMPARSSDWRQ